MRIGVPTEVKDHEFRVAATPAGVAELVRHGHDVVVQAGAGEGSFFPDAEYRAVGAEITRTADDVWAAGELILKVKEPVSSEWHRMRRGQTLFAYLHLAADRACTEAVLGSGITAIAYETVELPDGSLPLLAPMSEVAGRLATQVGAHTLMKSQGGRGVLMGGVPGADPARVVILGGGVVGTQAALMAVGLHAEVVIIDASIPRLRQLDTQFDGRVTTLHSNTHTIERELLEADLVVGSVLVPGSKAPRLVSHELVERMLPGSVLVDVAIDQGGCFEDSRPTTHSEPTYPVAGSVFYCVTNMPAAVPRTSTSALTNSTVPYVLTLADQGWEHATNANPALAKGLTAHDGELLDKRVAEAWNL